MLSQEPVGFPPALIFRSAVAFNESPGHGSHGICLEIDTGVLIERRVFAALHFDECIPRQISCCSERDYPVLTQRQLGVSPLRPAIANRKGHSARWLDDRIKTTD